MSEWRVITGDCIEVMRGMEPGSVDCVIADPPYNVGFAYATYRDNMPFHEYLQWQLDILREVARILTEDGNCFYLNYPEAAAYVWAATQEAVDGLTGVEWLTWIYHPHTSGSPLRKATRAWLWFARCEDNYIGAADILGEYRNPDDTRIQQKQASGQRPVDRDWWLYEQVKNVCPEKTEHPCQVPEEMVGRLIRIGCKPGGTVFDPFTGSGTTGVAALREERNFVGTEVDSRYADIARRRIAGWRHKPVRQRAQDAPEGQETLFDDVPAAAQQQRA